MIPNRLFIGQPLGSVITLFLEPFWAYFQATKLKGNDQLCLCVAQSLLYHFDKCETNF